MHITGAMFAEKLEVDGNQVNITGGSPNTFVCPNNDGRTVVVPVLLFVQPSPGDNGSRLDFKANIVDTEGDVVGHGPAIAAPDFRIGPSLAVCEIHTEFARPWHYFLYVGEERITGFDVHFAVGI